MGKYVVKQVPKAMPAAPTVDRLLGGELENLTIVSSRGEKNSDNKDPNYAVHGTYRVVRGNLAQAQGKHVLAFTHGYNVSPEEGIIAAKSFFRLMFKAIGRDGIDASQIAPVLFTWPGDTGPLYFNAAQQFAQHSGAALYRFLDDAAKQGARSSNLVSHSLGAHVVLRCLSIVGERRYHKSDPLRVARAVLLAAAVENDVFARPERSEEYHFPEAAFGVEHLHMIVSRGDEVLGGAFRVNEADTALGFNGPESMSPLASLSRRVQEISAGKDSFKFEVHDFSPTSSTIMNPALHVSSHGGYWETQEQANYYVNLVHIS
jgi:esterase/lipase superfamily enzyme